MLNGRIKSKRKIGKSRRKRMSIKHDLYERLFLYFVFFFSGSNCDNCEMFGFLPAGVKFKVKLVSSSGILQLLLRVNLIVFVQPAVWGNSALYEKCMRQARGHMQCVKKEEKK